jgi:hypothetical protein
MKSLKVRFLPDLLHALFVDCSVGFALLALGVRWREALSAFSNALVSVEPNLSPTGEDLVPSVLAFVSPRLRNALGLIFSLSKRTISSSND